MRLNRGLYFDIGPVCFSAEVGGGYDISNNCVEEYSIKLFYFFNYATTSNSVSVCLPFNEEKDYGLLFFYAAGEFFSFYILEKLSFNIYIETIRFIQ